MGDCSYCGNSDVLTRKCNNCGKEVCTEHTLPEKHDCHGLDVSDTKHFQSNIDAKLGGERESSSSSHQTSKRETRVADDRNGVKKDKKSKTDIDEYKKRQDVADLVSSESDGSEDDDSGENKPESGDFKTPSDLPPRPDNLSKSGGDSSPDVSPDGSLKPKNSQLNRELDGMREDANREKSRVQRARRKLRILWLRFYLAATSVRFWLVILVAVASAGQLGLVGVPGMPVDDKQVSGIVDDVDGVVSNSPETTDRATRRNEQSRATTVSKGEDSDFLGREALNQTEIENRIHREINERRQNHGLRSIAFDSQLREIARYHSRDMGESEYFAHESPSGETMGDRYDKYGYDCRVSVNATHSTTGAENIAYTYAFTDVTGPNGETLHHDSESDIAQGLVNQWMNSTGHRENILKPYWENEGIGIFIGEVDGKTRVYATQNFC